MRTKNATNWLAGAAMAMITLIAQGQAQDVAKAAPMPQSPAATTASVTPPQLKPGEAIAPALPLFIVHFITGPGWDKDKAADEQNGFKEHSQNLSRMRAAGMLVLGARYQDSVADKGMLIVRADNAEAVSSQFVADPMVKNKLFVLDIAAFMPFFEGFVGRPTRTIAADSPLNALTWLAGCWFGRSGKNEFREHWMRPAGGLMLGMGRTISGGKAVSYEAMRIELDSAGAPVFVAKPSGQPEASFKRLKFDATSIVFENAEHDFPQVIKYQLQPDGALHAQIEGKLKGRDARIEFPMRRGSCE
ncbi:MAG: hypothetical protein IPP88_23210 [Betaproteobacteria bacterium]|nr:hypothetical protein [Betaproteobacteria bacterium]